MAVRLGAAGGQALPACRTEAYSYYRLHGHSVCSLAELTGHLRSGAAQGGMAYGQMQPPCTDAQMGRAIHEALRGLPGCWNIYHVASLRAVALMKQAGR